MVIKSVEEIEHLKKTILINADIAYAQLKARTQALPTISFLTEVKFDKIGVDPLRGSALNFIEQLNQMFSDLVALEGAGRLLCLYPEKEFRLSLGPASGFDIESTDGDVVAECFAITTVTSNRKLEKDCAKLTDKAFDKQKYVYFYSRSDSEEKLQRIYDKYPEITFTRIAEFKF